jgi:hypothetical protein
MKGAILAHSEEAILVHSEGAILAYSEGAILAQLEGATHRSRVRLQVKYKIGNPPQLEL